MVNDLFKCFNLHSSTFSLSSRLVKSFWSSLLKILILLLLASFFNLTNVVSAQASTCRQLDNHSICIVSIKRSAKYYWEYRAAISVDGRKQPVEIYNCRDRLKINYHKTVVPFATNGVGELICSLYTK